MKYLIHSLLLLILYIPAHAAIETYEFNSQETEAEYKALIDELRCLVCQNQNLAGSDADLAKDLRQQTFEMLQQGKSREQIVEYMVNRYGDFVLYRPPVKSSTLLLWIGPFVLLLAVLVMVILRIKKQTKVAEPEQENLNQAKGLLADDETKKDELT